MKQIQYSRANRGKRARAFTLIELLVVVAIIGILAGLLNTAFSKMQDKKAKAGARAQLVKLEALIESYHAQYNSYPLDNPDLLAPHRNAVHPLYYELVGSTYNGPPANRYDTVSENITETAVRTYFKQDGLRNVTQDGSNPESPKARNFMESMNADDVQALNAGEVRLLRFRIKDIEANMLTNSAGDLFNPWRYVATNPTNNQGRYDLWVEFEVGGNRYRASNWEKDIITLARPKK